MAAAIGLVALAGRAAAQTPRWNGGGWYGGRTPVQYRSPQAQAQKVEDIRAICEGKLLPLENALASRRGEPAAAMAFSFAFPRGSLHVNLGRLSRVTEWALRILVAQFVIHDDHGFSEAGLLPVATLRTMTPVGPAVRHNSLFILRVVALPLLGWLTRPPRAVLAALGVWESSRRSGWRHEGSASSSASSGSPPPRARRCSLQPGGIRTPRTRHL